MPSVYRCGANDAKLRRCDRDDVRRVRCPRCPSDICPAPNELLLVASGISTSSECCEYWPPNALGQRWLNIPELNGAHILTFRGYSRCGLSNRDWCCIWTKELGYATRIGYDQPGCSGHVFPSEHLIMWVASSVYPATGLPSVAVFSGFTNDYSWRAAMPFFRSYRTEYLCPSFFNGTPFSNIYTQFCPLGDPLGNPAWGGTATVTPR